MTAKIIIQPGFVPIGTANVGGQPVQVTVTNEWRRSIEYMAKLINDQQATIEALKARLDAGGL